jgi:hypothetical protein
LLDPCGGVGRDADQRCLLLVRALLRWCVTAAWRVSRPDRHEHYIRPGFVHVGDLDVE